MPKRTVYGHIPITDPPISHVHTPQNTVKFRFQVTDTGGRARTVKNIGKRQSGVYKVQGKTYHKAPRQGHPGVKVTICHKSKKLMLQSSHDESSITSTAGARYLQGSGEDLSQGGAGGPPEREGDGIYQVQEHDDTVLT